MDHIQCVTCGDNIPAGQGLRITLHLRSQRAEYLEAGDYRRWFNGELIVKAVCEDHRNELVQYLIGRGINRRGLKERIWDGV